MGIWYCTRESVKRALDIAETARNNAQIDRAIDTGARSVEGLLHRKFYPLHATRYFDWPDRRRSYSWRLWLDQHEVIRVDELRVAGVVIDPSDYFLEPANEGPPFNAIEMRLGGSAAFAGGDDGHQRAIEMDGLFNYDDETEPAGELAAGGVDISTSTADITDSSKLGVGSILLIEDEYLIVTGKSMLDTGQDLGGDLAEQKSATSVSVPDGTAYHEDEVILIDAERMLIEDIAGNTLIVKRAWDGSVLASHTTGADIFAPHRLSVIRGALGSTAASHSGGTDVATHAFPGTVRDLNVAEAIDQLQQEPAGYGRTIGSGESERLLGGRGLADIRKEAVTRYGRKARTGAI